MSAFSVNEIEQAETLVAQIVGMKTRQEAVGLVAGVLHQHTDTALRIGQNLFTVDQKNLELVAEVKSLAEANHNLARHIQVHHQEEMQMQDEITRLTRETEVLRNRYVAVADLTKRNTKLEEQRDELQEQVEAQNIALRSLAESSQKTENDLRQEILSVRHTMQHAIEERAETIAKLSADTSQLNADNNRLQRKIETLEFPQPVYSPMPNVVEVNQPQPLTKHWFFPGYYGPEQPSRGMSEVDLMKRPDPRFWAQQFVSQFRSWVVGSERVDEALMESWFASAMETGHQKQTPHEVYCLDPQQIEAAHQAGATWMLDEIRYSLQQYPDVGGDTEVMKAVEAIGAEFVRRALAVARDQHTDELMRYAAVAKTLSAMVQTGLTEILHEAEHA